MVKGLRAGEASAQQLIMCPCKASRVLRSVSNQGSQVPLGKGYPYSWTSQAWQGHPHSCIRNQGSQVSLIEDTTVKGGCF